MDSSHRHTTGSKNLILNFKPDCPLCRLADEPRMQADYVCELKNSVVTRGPFAKRWAGAIQVTSKRHVKDPSQLKYPHFIHSQSELYQLETAVRRATRAKLMNVVKFGNVVDHLHWHIIPRFEHEIHPQKNPWELASTPDSELFHTPYTGSRDELYSDIVAALNAVNKELQPAFFSTAFFIRPKNAAAQADFLKHPLPVQHQLIRSNPAQFECFLMQRNYLDYAWDTFGGEADPHETPKEALLRELCEELGWTADEVYEVTRQWNNGLLRGFCYLVRPSQGQLLQNQPERIACDEVKDAKWIALVDLIENKGDTYAAPLCGRVRAVVAGEPDFYL
ncbi:MAG: NUDIX domain-containing protein [Proteobacteria bacterium]|nr:NUDIX domain-containing protein [Pseudomonadota bacterium]